MILNAYSVGEAQPSKLGDNAVEFSKTLRGEKDFL